ncbi:MAG: uroporphyrinogen-III decarboxylase-like protein [Kiritimatiellae bacterium]|nr:uroporphyrinogen-III decarboxylase-like protein [Kiritimatiellia bacterium]
MTRKQAIRKALAFEPVSPVPYHLDFTLDMRAKLQTHYGQQDVDTAVGNCMLCINVGSNAGAEVNRVAAGLMEPLGEERYRDEWGVEWDKSGGDDIGVPVNQVVPEPDLSALHVPDPADARRWQGYGEIAATAGDRYVLACFSSPLFQRQWFLRGLGTVLMDLALYPAFTCELLDVLTEFDLGIVRGVAARGADGIFFYDDYAQQSGPLFSPAMFGEFYTPRLKRIFGEARERGLDVFFHCCGDVSLILDDIVEAGAQVFNPFQPEVLDVQAVARKYAGRLAFYGGLSTQKTLPFGTPDDVRAETRMLIDLFAAQGGYIFSAAHAIQRDVPVENVVALVDLLRDGRMRQ